MTYIYIVVLIYHKGNYEECSMVYSLASVKCQILSVLTIKLILIVKLTFKTKINFQKFT